MEDNQVCTSCGGELYKAYDVCAMLASNPPQVTVLYGCPVCKTTGDIAYEPYVYYGEGRHLGGNFYFPPDGRSIEERLSGLWEEEE